MGGHGLLLVLRRQRRSSPCLSTPASHRAALAHYHQPLFFRRHSPLRSVPRHVPSLAAAPSGEEPDDGSGSDYEEIELLLTPEEEAILDQNKTADVTKISSVNEMASASYIRWLQIPLMDKLLDNGVDIDLVDKDGATPLHYAVQVGALQTVKLLIKYRVDVSVADVDGWTPLHLSGTSRNRDITKILLVNGADQTRRTNGGKTPLDLSLCFGRTSTHMIWQSFSNLFQPTGQQRQTEAEAQNYLVPQLHADHGLVGERRREPTSSPNPHPTSAKQIRAPPPQRPVPVTVLGLVSREVSAQVVLREVDVVGRYRDQEVRVAERVAVRARPVEALPRAPTCCPPPLAPLVLVIWPRPRGAASGSPPASPGEALRQTPGKHEHRRREAGARELCWESRERKDEPGVEGVAPRRWAVREGADCRLSRRSCVLGLRRWRERSGSDESGQGLGLSVQVVPSCDHESTGSKKHVLSTGFNGSIHLSETLLYLLLDA
ncbi:hypothetical protein ZWY2020_049570 [Hordeum vulgare]|nr:hypothetical protein ZWY2020_049570 [Hordeum vulgare]